MAQFRRAQDQSRGAGRRWFAVAAWASLALAACLALTAGGCNRAPAEAALAETDRALASARSQLERYASSDLARIEADEGVARSLLARGEYTEALRIAQKLPGRVAIAAERIAAKKRDLGPQWSRLAGSVPSALEALEARIGEIEAGVRRPRGFDAEQIGRVKAELGGMRDAWARAEAASRAGDVIAGTAVAEEIRGQAEGLSGRLNPTPNPGRSSGLAH